jgi:predicted DNA-binding transcriptional regulator AlpA
LQEVRAHSAYPALRARAFFVARLQRLTEERTLQVMSNPTPTEQPAAVVVRPGARLLSKGEMLDKVGLTYPSVWKLMREGAFPRAVVLGGKNAWLEHEVDAFIAALPRRRLKGQDDGVPYHKAATGAAT